MRTTLISINQTVETLALYMHEETLAGKNEG